MKQKIKNYLKCALVNKVTFAGYISLGIGIAGVHSIEKDMDPNIICLSYLICLTGTSLLGVSALGLETYSTYTRTKKHIAKNGRVDPRYNENSSNLYCNRIGFDLALKEARLERIVNNKNP